MECLCGAGGGGAGAGHNVQALGADGAGSGEADKGRGRARGKGKKVGGAGVPGRTDVSLGRNTGSSGGVAVGRMDSGGLGVVCKSSSFLKCLMTARMLDARSPRERAIIREVNETVFALNLLEMGGIGCPESCEKVGHSILSTDLAFVVSTL